MITEAENCHGSVTITRGVSMILKFGVPPLAGGHAAWIMSYRVTHKNFQKLESSGNNMQLSI